jgi:hypothetical protein
MALRSLGTLVLLLLACGTARAQIIYTLNQPALFESSPFGFSGTVITDGSTGVLASVDFIESWSITVLTPATVDGVSSEHLDPANSSLSLFLSGTPGLIVTPESISLSLSLTPVATLTWSTQMNETVLQFSGRIGTGGSVTVSDPSETNPVLGIVARGAPIASNGVLVLEPSALAIATTCLLTVTFVRRRNRPLPAPA